MKRLLALTSMAVCLAFGCGDNSSDDSGDGSGSSGSSGKGDSYSDYDRLCADYADRVVVCAGPGGQFVPRDAVYQGCLLDLADEGDKDFARELEKRECYLDAPNCTEADYCD